MKFYDISMPIADGMLSWPSDPEVKIGPAKNVAEHGSNVEAIQSGMHLGTHVDAPKHFSDTGSGVDTIPFDSLIGRVQLIDLTDIDGELIKPEHLPEQTAERVLFKTANTTRGLLTKPYTEDYVALSGEAAEELARRGTKLVGIDYLSIQKRGDDRRAHTALLDNDIAIIEGLWLTNVPAGDYELIALPLRLKDGSGAPARVVLRQTA